MKVRISYSPNRYDIGTVKDLPEDEARLLIREGRAQAYYGNADPGDGTSVTVVPSAQSSPGRQAEGSEQPASTSTPAKPAGVKRTTATNPAPPAA